MRHSGCVIELLLLRPQQEQQCDSTASGDGVLVKSMKSRTKRQELRRRKRGRRMMEGHSEVLLQSSY